MRISNILKEFKQEIGKFYGQKLKGVILYGSWARGDATEKSDIDLLIVLAGQVVSGQEIDRMMVQDVHTRRNA
jgi:predicted nucleotidyltransferase